MATTRHPEHLVTLCLLLCSDTNSSTPLSWILWTVVVIFILFYVLAGSWPLLVISAPSCTSQSQVMPANSPHFHVTRKSKGWPSANYVLHACFAWLVCVWLLTLHFFMSSYVSAKSLVHQACRSWSTNQHWIMYHTFLARLQCLHIGICHNLMRPCMHPEWKLWNNVDSELGSWGGNSIQCDWACFASTFKRFRRHWLSNAYSRWKLVNIV